MNNEGTLMPKTPFFGEFTWITLNPGKEVKDYLWSSADEIGSSLFTYCQYLF